MLCSEVMRARIVFRPCGSLSDQKLIVSPAHARPLMTRQIASELCVYTNNHFTMHSLDVEEEESEA